MTNKVKPFYIKITDDMTPQMVQDAFDKCVDAGAIANDCIENAAKKNDGWGYFGSIHDWELFGVCKIEGTWLGDNQKYMSCNAAQEINLDQLDEWLGLKAVLDWEDEDDLPPVGSKVMTSFTESDCDSWCDFHGPSEIIAYHGDYVWIAHHGKFNRIHALTDIEFEKPETPEQKAERERQYAVYDMCSDLDNHTDDARFWCEKLYDLGYRKQ